MSQQHSQEAGPSQATPEAGPAQDTAPAAKKRKSSTAENFLRLIKDCHDEESAIAYAQGFGLIPRSRYCRNCGTLLNKIS